MILCEIFGCFCHFLLWLDIHIGEPLVFFQMPREFLFLYFPIIFISFFLPLHLKYVWSQNKSCANAKTNTKQNLWNVKWIERAKILSAMRNYRFNIYISIHWWADDLCLKLLIHVFLFIQQIKSVPLLKERKMEKKIFSTITITGTQHEKA